MNALGVHIFAGGFSIGVEKHFDLLGHLERGSFGVDSWRRYRPRVPVTIDKEARWSDVVAAHRGKVDLLYGNPPCSPWSNATPSRSSTGTVVKRGVDTSLIKWTTDVVRVGAAVEARAVVVESVRGAVKGRAFYDALWREHRSAFASQMWVLVNAADHGLPQWRQRLFWVLAPDVFRPDRRVEPASLLGCIEGAPACEPWVKHDLHGHNRPLWDSFPLLFSTMKPGDSAIDLPEDFLGRISPKYVELMRARKIFSNAVIKRMRADQPMDVVWGGAGRFVHPTEDRLMTLRELMRVSGYPDDFEFVSTKARPMGDKLNQLGKTVCPPVGEWIAGEVKAYLEGDRQTRGPGQATFDCSTKSKGDPEERRQLTIEDLFFD